MFVCHEPRFALLPQARRTPYSNAIDQLSIARDWLHQDCLVAVYAMTGEWSPIEACGYILVLSRSHRRLPPPTGVVVYLSRSYLM